LFILSGAEGLPLFFFLMAFSSGYHQPKAYSLESITYEMQIL